MLYVVYAITLLILTIYSYSQIDLNLTLSSNNIYQFIQQQLILLGYFNRPLSTLVLIVLLFLLYLFYLIILLAVTKNKLSAKNIKWLIILSCIILLFSYSAFSHDLFNYMFDARIVTTYHQNPYLHSALDFPADLWTRFMHWTHRTYPYGPIWLLITLVPSLLGFGKFVLTLINFKFMFVVFHIGNALLIYKILSKTDKTRALLGTAVYALNPVILIESLVSPHNEVIMLFFLLWAIYFVICENNKLAAIFNLLLSAGIKFATLILLPLFLFIRSNRKVAKNTKLLLLSLFLLAATLVAEIIYREPYSWYFIPILGIGALLIKHPSINILIGGVSLAAFLRYLPFIYTGEYSKSVRYMQDLIFLTTIALTIFFIILKSLIRKAINKKS